MTLNGDEKNMVGGENNTKTTNDEIGRKTLRKRIRELALPALAEHLLGTLFGMVDMVMVGNVNTESLAAVGLTNQPMLMAISVFQALNVGSTALIARYMGTEDNETAGAVVKQTLIITLILGIVLTVPGYFFAENMMSFMGAKSEVLPLATQYLKIIALGGVFITISMGIGAALRGSGDTVTPMRYNIVSNLLNVVLNYILIYGKLGFPAMGITGAAIATTLSRFIGMILALLAIYHPNSILSLAERKGFYLDFKIIKRILNIGIPSGVEQLDRKSVV